MQPLMASNRRFHPGSKDGALRCHDASQLANTTPSAANFVSPVSFWPVSSLCVESVGSKLSNIFL